MRELASFGRLGSGMPSALLGSAERSVPLSRSLADDNIKAWINNVLGPLSLADWEAIEPRIDRQRIENQVVWEIQHIIDENP